MAHETWHGHYDTITSDSMVRLFGKEMYDLRLRAGGRQKTYDGPPEREPDAEMFATPPNLSKNKFLAQQLQTKNARLARIYCFSYLNQIFDMVRPAIFLVHGKGAPVRLPGELADLDLIFLRQGPTFSERSGVAGQKGNFAPEVRVWAYDRADMTVRLDIETGTLEQVLIDMELGAVESGSMGAGDTDDVRRPRRPRWRRRRWRSDED